MAKTKTETNAKTKLRPCPFCGKSEHIIRRCRVGGITHALVFCAWCHSEGPGACSDDVAIAAWNRRAKPKGGTP